MLAFLNLLLSGEFQALYHEAEGTTNPMDSPCMFLNLYNTVDQLGHPADMLRFRSRTSHARRDLGVPLGLLHPLLQLQLWLELRLQRLRVHLEAVSDVVDAGQHSAFGARRRSCFAAYVRQSGAEDQQADWRGQAHGQLPVLQQGGLQAERDIVGRSYRLIHEAFL